MNLIKKILLIGILILTTQAFSQKIDTVKSTRNKQVVTYKKLPQKWPIEVGYFTPFGLHIGITVNTSFTFKERHIYINKNRFLRLFNKKAASTKREKIVYRMLESGFSVYRQKDFQNALMLNIISGKYIKERYKGFRYGAGMGLQALLIDYPGFTYSVKADNTIVKKRIAGRAHGVYNFSLSMGWNFARDPKYKTNLIFMYTANAAIISKFGYSSSFQNYNSVSFIFTIDRFTRFVNKSILRKDNKS